MTGPRPFVEHAADALGAAIGPLLLGVGALSLVMIAFEAAVRWRARP